jgi:hypothetical protein
MRNTLPHKLRHYKGPAEKFHPYFMNVTDAFPRRRWEDNIKMDLQEVGGVVGTGCSWLRIWTSGGHL